MSFSFFFANFSTPIMKRLQFIERRFEMGEALGKLIGLVVESVLISYGAYSISKKAIDKIFPEDNSVETGLNDEWIKDYEFMREGIGA